MTRTSQTLNADDVLGLLVPRRRRAMLRVLLEQSDDAVDLPTLAERVKQRCDADLVAPTADELEIRLHHTDLPKLDEAGLITYDSDTHSVRYHPHSGVEALLDTLATRFE